MGTMDAVLDAALKLSPKDRALIAETLIESLEETDAKDVERAWVGEVERRMVEEGGSESFVDLATVRADVNQILKR